MGIHPTSVPTALQSFVINSAAKEVLSDTAEQHGEKPSFQGTWTNVDTLVHGQTHPQPERNPHGPEEVLQRSPCQAVKTLFAKGLKPQILMSNWRRKPSKVSNCGFHYFVSVYFLVALKWNGDLLCCPLCWFRGGVLAASLRFQEFEYVKSQWFHSQGNRVLISADPNDSSRV